MYQCSNCPAKVTHLYATQCSDCFHRTPKHIDSAFEPETAMKDKIQEMINKTIDDTTLELNNGAYTKLDMRIYMDTLKQKIKGNLAKELRSL